MHTGTVRWFSYSKGCGYIIPDDGSADVFAHFSGFRDVTLRALERHERVNFRSSAGPMGAVASNIYTIR